MDEFHPRMAVNPVAALLLPFPFVCFFGCLTTDLAYWHSENVQWETFSIWLLTAGLVMAGFGIIATLVDLFSKGRDRAITPSWLQLIGFVLALGLSLVNAFVHSGDGYTAVVPKGIALSAIVVLILILTNWNGFAVSYRHASEGAN